MRINSFNNPSFNNPFIKPLQTNTKNNVNTQPNSSLAKDTVSFGNYYSVGRGQKPEIRRLAEQALESSGDVSGLMNTANEMKERALALIASGNSSLKGEADSLMGKAEQMIRDIQAEVAAHSRRIALLQRY